MEDSHPLLAEDPGDIKLIDTQGAPHLAGAVVPHPRCPESKAAVGDVELMAITPGPALVYLNPFIADIPRVQLTLDEGRHRTTFDKLGQHQALLAQRGGNIDHITLRTGGLHVKVIAVVYGHPVIRRDPYAHAGRARNGILVVITNFYVHGRNLSLASIY